MTIRAAWRASPLLAASGLALVVRTWLRGGLPERTSPALLVAVAAAGFALAAVDQATRARHLRGDRTLAALIAGAAASALLVLGAGGRVLEWRLVVSSGGVPLELPGTGLVLGVMLLAALAGALLLAAHRMSAGGSALATTLGRRALMLAAALGVLAIGLVADDALAGDASRAIGLADTAAGLVGVTWLLACGGVALLVEDSGDAAAAEALSSRWVALAAALAGGALLVAGLFAWREQGSYLAGFTRSTLVAALAGLAAVQPTGLRLVRSLLFAGALVAVVAAS